MLSSLSELQQQQQQLPDIISFNCGGELVTVQRSKILSRFPKSYLANFIQVAADPFLSKSLDRDRNGNILLDRDPRLFLCVVNFCRGYRNVGPINDEELEALGLEADYWCIPQLRMAVEERLGIVDGVLLGEPHHRLHFSHAPPPEETEKMNFMENQELFEEFSQDYNGSSSSSNNNNNNNTFISRATQKILDDPWCDLASKEKLTEMDEIIAARAKFVFDNIFLSALSTPPDLRFMRGPGVNSERTRFRNANLVGILTNTLAETPYTIEEQQRNIEIEQQKQERRLLIAANDSTNADNNNNMMSSSENDSSCEDIALNSIKNNNNENVAALLENSIVKKPLHTPADNLVMYPSSGATSFDGGVPMSAGVHTLFLEVHRAEYLAVGIVSDHTGKCNIPLDSEFHRTPGCISYYQTGVFYSNTPASFKEENLAKFTPGCVIQLRLDMDNRLFECFVNGNCERMQSITFFTRVRFAAMLKYDTCVSVVSPDRAAYLIGAARAEKIQTYHEKLAKELIARRIRLRGEQLKREHAAALQAFIENQTSQRVKLEVREMIEIKELERGFLAAFLSRSTSVDTASVPFNSSLLRRRGRGRSEASIERSGNLTPILLSSSDGEGDEDENDDHVDYRRPDQIAGGGNSTSNGNNNNNNNNNSSSDFVFSLNAANASTGSGQGATSNTNITNNTHRDVQSFARVLEGRHLAHAMALRTAQDGGNNNNNNNNQQDDAVVHRERAVSRALEDVLIIDTNNTTTATGRALPTSSTEQQDVARALRAHQEYRARRIRNEQARGQAWALQGDDTAIGFETARAMALRTTQNDGNNNNSNNVTNNTNTNRDGNNNNSDDNNMNNNGGQGQGNGGGNNQA